MRLPELVARNGARTTLWVGLGGVWRVDCAPYEHPPGDAHMVSLSTVELAVTGDPYWQYQEEIFYPDLDRAVEAYRAVVETWPRMVELVAAQKARPRGRRRPVDAIAGDLVLIHRAVTEH